MLRPVAIVLLFLLAPFPAFAADGMRMAVFPVEFVNTSLEPTRDDERVRLAAFDRQLRSALEARGYAIVDTTPVAAEMARYASLRECNGCELGLARRLGAELVALAWVQKVSNLILEITVRIGEVETGKLLHAGSVSIRGNTDESWAHGLRYLLRYVLFRER
ncbi:hypothetical protein HRbin40_01866 [bacterium HR40]|nr:hypothetical protein HRbin40_01866 [bacterium HR40]